MNLFLIMHRHKLLNLCHTQTGKQYRYTVNISQIRKILGIITLIIGFGVSCLIGLIELPPLSLDDREGGLLMLINLEC